MCRDQKHIIFYHCNLGSLQECWTIFFIKKINDNLDSFGHLLLVHVIKLHVESLAGEDHGPALTDEAGADDSNFFIF